MKQSKSKTLPNRLWFLARGYRKHPIFNLWGHEGCAYFLGACGQKLAHTYSPSNRKKQTKRGYYAPCMRHFGSRSCHTLMGEIFYGERPTFIDSKGNPYFGHCHHLINDLLDYSPDNLLCWLTYSEHHKVDNRRRALEELYPDLHVFSYAELRVIQDPRITTDNEFAQMMVKYEQLYEQEHGPLFKRFDTLYRSTVLRSTRITREERARAKAVWDHMSPDQRSTLMLRMNAGVGITERMDYTLAHFVGRIKN